MMNERIIFILLLCVIVVLWRIIGYWRKRAGESAFTAAQMDTVSKSVSELR